MLAFLWSVLVIVVFFGGSIIVHEYGHFWMARKHGLKVTRFSFFGIGPPIVKWMGKDGVEYCICWFPIGAYVQIPQLAEMGKIEGNLAPEDRDLPPPPYPGLVLTLVGGAAMNIVFAFLLASILWFVGQPVSKEDQTTRVGHVQPVVTLTDGQTVPGPALEAGIRQGDVIRMVDGKSVATFNDINTLVALGAGRTADGRPQVELTVERDGRPLPVTIVPAYTGDEEIREIGIEPAVQPMVAEVFAGSPAEAAGLEAGDVILALDGQPAEYVSFVSEYLRLHGANPVRVTYERDGETGEATITPRLTQAPGSNVPVPLIGVGLGGRYSTTLVHTAPWIQMRDHAVNTWRTLASLLNPKSDIGPSKLSGPVGIARVFHITAQIDIRLVLWFTVLVNVNLAMLNLLPIPVLDGGHIVFATISRLRGRPLPMQAIATVQSVFMALLFAMILYVTFFDVRRIARDRAPAPAAEAPQPTPAATPATP